MVNLRKRFVAGKAEEGNFNYIGFKVAQNRDVIILDQSNYVTNIQNITIKHDYRTDRARALDTCRKMTSQKIREIVCVEVLRPSQPKWGHVERGQFT